jgi:hypothetical protein
MSEPTDVYEFDGNGNFLMYDAEGNDFLFLQGDTEIAAVAAHLGGPQEPNSAAGLSQWVKSAFAWLREHEGEKFDLSDYK